MKREELSEKLTVVYVPRQPCWSGQDFTWVSEHESPEEAKGFQELYAKDGITAKLYPARDFERLKEKVENTFTD